MADYSNSVETVLANLTVRNIHALFNIVDQATLKEKQFVRRSYEEKATHFDETLRFLQDIGWMREQGTKLAATEPAFRASKEPEDLLGRYVTEAVFKAVNPYRLLFADYLTQFSVNGSDITYEPIGERRLEDSSVRNFLIDAKVIRHRHAPDDYVVAPKCADLFLWAKNITGPRARSVDAAARRHELGTDAEIAVVQFEMRRIGPKFANEVDHVAAKNPFACYDVRSVTVADGAILPRFIEVKAVSADSYEFFWTAAEIEAASLLETEYFLYLLPVKARNQFDFEKLLVVENAYKVVYQQREQWQVEENVVVCRRIERSSQSSSFNEN